ncbi:MAG: aminopeptidase P family protein [Ruminococcus sp.]|nr:aminopeptidase P family protein [Ruminococcus sp.]
MKTQRLERIIESLSQQGLEQMVICDPCSVFYLTGKMIKPGERMLALYINSDSTKNRIFINELFTVNEDLGIEKVRFDDNADAAALLAGFIDHSKPLGIDKKLEARFLLRLMECNAATKYVNSSECVDYVRSQKDAEEACLMRVASKINDKAMGEIIKRIGDGSVEESTAAQMLDIYKSFGAEGYSFEPLVGFGESAAIGHYEGGSRVLKEGDCVLIDVGCTKDNYCSDMTRTFFYKKVSDERRKIYEIVKKAQQAAIEAVKPGVRYCDVDKVARDIITEVGYGEYFTHRLGHSIGIECHEYGDVSSANENVLKPGMVFSIEPGIYLEGDVGVRIEDLVMVTESGVEVLNSFTKELTIIG